MIDLHSHSTASDGELSPSELVLFAKESGVTVLALTDHDTVSGLEEAAATAAREGVTFVPGVELNIGWHTGEFHLLGLGITAPSPELLEMSDVLQDERKCRNKRIIQKMRDAGYSVEYDEFVELFGGAEREKRLGRPHLASYLVKKGLAKKIQMAFDKFLGKLAPFYIDRQGARLEDAVSAITTSGGVPVIAHPLSLYVSWSRLNDVLDYIKARGVQGMEAWHPTAREGECRRLERLGKEMGFFITAGSDYHGKNVRADRRIGITAGEMKIADRFYYEELLPHISVC